MNPLDIVGLAPLMARSEGRRDLTIALIDGPVAMNHAELAHVATRHPPGTTLAGCARVHSAGCQHGTFVAGILFARRGSDAPAICPGCTLMIRPIFLESNGANREKPRARSEELADAIIECVDAGAAIINLSCTVTHASARAQQRVNMAVDYAARHAILIVAAAGNDGAIGGSVLTRHPWVLPVVGCDSRFHPLTDANLGLSICRRGLRAPGAAITSLAADGGRQTLSGASAAAPFVTGALALLWSEFPHAGASHLLQLLRMPGALDRRAFLPAKLDAWAAYTNLLEQRRTA
jgi:subtilisin family serine protease